MRIRTVKPLRNFKAKIAFTNGITKVVDLSRHITGPLFGAMRRRREFLKMRVGEGGALEWPNGADICPDVLFYGGIPPWAKKAAAKYERHS